MPQPRPYKVALNGYGRIGRCVLRALFERGAAAGFEIVAINDLADMASIEYLTRFDSTHGRFPGEVRVEGDCLHINGNCVQVLRSATPEGIDWKALGVDLVLECSAITPVPMASVSSTPAHRVCCFPSRWPARRMSTPPSSTASTRIA